MSFVFANAIVRLFKTRNIDIEKLRSSIDSAMVQSCQGRDAERTESVKVSGTKSITASVTLKDVTKATKIEATRPLRFAYLSQTLSNLEKVYCAPRNVELSGDLETWMLDFQKPAPKTEADPAPTPADGTASAEPVAETEPEPEPVQA